MKAKEQTVPSLRFPGFESNWEQKQLKDLTKINQGLQIAISERYTSPIDGGYFYITNEFLRENSRTVYYIKNPSKSVTCNKNDILMTRTGNTGQVVTGVEGAFHNNFFKILYREECDRWFLYYFLTSHKTQHTILKLAGTSTIPDLNHGDFYKISISIPSLPEQQKIASFLTVVDSKVEQLSKKKALLEQYKKAMMQKLFSQELRFKDEQGNEFSEWEEKRLCEVFDRVTTKNTINNKNVLTISAQMGLINQMDYFNHSVSAKDVTGYYLLKKGDFAYNKSYSKGYPMGAIKRLTEYESGVVSTLYICFRAKNADMQPFFEKLFDSGHQNYWIHKIAQEGARNHGLLNMAVGDFFQIPLPVPSPDEQQKITTFLSSIDKKINLITTELNQAQTFKKGLLQQMFI